MTTKQIAFGIAALAIVAGIAVHFVGITAKGMGATPGPGLADLQAWLLTGGGGAMILTWLTKFLPTMGVPEQISTPALEVANIGRIKAALAENAANKDVCDSLTMAGRSAFDALRDETFPLTKATP